MNSKICTPLRAALEEYRSRLVAPAYARAQGCGA